VKVIASPAALQRQAAQWLRSGRRIGLVPTMGALHAGHLELVHRAKNECDRVIVTIYVNPTQFGPKEDLARYPRQRRKDLALCRQAGADIVFAPANLYLPDHSTWVEETDRSTGREGASRPGHFRGVATIVLKLLLLARPTHAYFGRKDGQQLEVIQRLVRDLNVPVKIVPVPTVRDRDGLALSSRNRYLSPEERLLAGTFAQLVHFAASKGRSAATVLRHDLKKLRGVQLDYAEISGGRLYAAVRIGTTRLIDNERVR